MNKSPYRIVNFPDNICLGEVQFLQRQDSSGDEENNVFGNAQGSIRVRENETLKLTVWEKESLPHLSKLRPDDLQEIEILLGVGRSSRSQKPTIRNDDLSHLVGLPDLTKLTIGTTGGVTESGRWRFYESGFTDQCLAHIGKLTRLTYLELNLDASQITNEGFKYLSALRKLEALTIYPSARMSEGGLMYLQPLQNPKRLALPTVPVAHPSVTYLNKMSRLEYLVLDFRIATDDGLQHLTGLRNLKVLELDKSSLSDKGMRHMPAFKKLERLGITRTNVTVRGLIYLQQLKELKHLSLGRTLLDTSQIDALKLAHPALELDFYM